MGETSIIRKGSLEELEALSWDLEREGMVK